MGHFGSNESHVEVLQESSRIGHRTGRKNVVDQRARGAIQTLTAKFST